MNVAIVNLGPDRLRRLARSVRAPATRSSARASASSRSAPQRPHAVESADVVIDAGGMTAIPGLIDSHVHVTFGDYTPRQRTVGYLESYLHGGTTTAISASEVHVPGRPSDPEGVKALALAAQRCFADYRPGGMRVIAGSVILEPGLQAADFTELAAEGRAARQGRLRRGEDRLRLRAAGGRRQSGRPDHHVPHRRLLYSRARARSPAIICSRCTRTCRSTSTAGRPRCPTRTSSASSASATSRCRSAPPETCAPRCCARGSPSSTARSTASSSRPTRRPAAASCRSACSTPSRICASLTDMTPERFICAATGSNARVYRPRQRLPRAPARPPISCCIDAPDGGTQSTALAAIKHGDIAAIGAVDHRRRAALRRPQPQHAGHHAQGAGRAFSGDAGFFSGGALAQGGSRAQRWEAVMEREPEQLFLDDFSAGQTYRDSRARSPRTTFSRSLP